MYKRITLGLTAQNAKRKHISAYTLAEMLLVMLIVSLMVLAIPPVTKKIYAEKTTRGAHGRYECYRNEANQIVEASSMEGGITNAPKVVDVCKFKVPTNSIYVLVHAVGGGGGGAYVTSNPTDSSYTLTVQDYYGNTVPNLFPDWLRELRDSGWQFPNNTSANMANLGIVTVNVAEMQFGYGGLQGERISMFFSKLDSSQSFEMIPGEAGFAGTSTGSYKGSDGTDTVVNFVKTEKDEATGTETSTTTELIRAKGGMGGGVSGAAKTWLYGGAPSDYGLADISARKRQEVNFVENIEGKVDETLKSYIADTDIQPGDGGGGAYSYINNTASTLTYTIEGVSVSNLLSFDTYLSKNPTANTNCTKSGTAHVCNKGSGEYSCVDGQEKSGLLCKPQNGGTGAVVILW